jgi:hypothetical protein
MRVLLQGYYAVSHFKGGHEGFILMEWKIVNVGLKSVTPLPTEQVL